MIESSTEKPTRAKKRLLLLMDPYAVEDAALAQKFLRLEPDRDLTEREQPECHNVVCQARFGGTIDLMWLIREFPHISFKRGRFPAATMWHRPPEGAAHQIFGSGKMMIMGIHSVPHACCSYQLQRRAFIQHGRADYSSFPIQDENQVYSYHLPYQIRIADLKWEDELSFIVVPKLFPGAIYRMKKPAVAMLIFESGSVMILGVREKSDLKAALDNILPLLEKHSYVPDPSAAGRGATGTSRKRPRTEDEKRAEKERKRTKNIYKRALKEVKHLPVRNKAEFEQKFEEQVELIKHGKSKRGGKKLVMPAAVAADAADVVLEEGFV